jgi:DNA polymerase III epsilon subunit-like protein
MKILIFDTETTGLPPYSKIICQETLDKWPHIVQFSYVIFDTEINNITLTKDSIVKLSNIFISEDSTNIHGITNEISKEKGENLQLILNEFFYHIRTCDLLVGHNVSFDINMITVELLRIIYNSLYPKEHIDAYKFDLHFLTNFKNVYCTLQESIDLCAIKTLDKYGREFNKWPKLSELHQKLFSSIPKNLHNSFNDILVTLRCFYKLKFKKDLLKDCEQFISLSENLKLF